MFLSIDDSEQVFCGSEQVFCGIHPFVRKRWEKCLVHFSDKTAYPTLNLFTAIEAYKNVINV